MRAYRAPTMTALHESLCSVLVHSPKEKLDVISSVDVQVHNTVSQADSMQWEFDLKNMWLTKSRWTMMINQYLDPIELQEWLEKCTGRIGTKGRGIATLRTKSVKARGGASTGHTNKETRRWGSCMLAITYKALPQPQITLYSRTSYLGYLAALDMSVAWMCGRYLAAAMGRDIEDFRFVWMNEALQYHNFKSMAYLLNHRDEEKAEMYRTMLAGKSMPRSYAEQVREAPALRMTRKWLQKLILEDEQGKTLGDMNYNTYRRIRRRYHTEVLGYEYAQQFEGWSVHRKGPKLGEQKEFFKAYQPLPSTPIETLSFERFGLRLDGDWAAEYDDAYAEDDDEDDD